MERVGLMLAAEGRGILPDRRHGSEGKQTRFITEVDDPAHVLAAEGSAAKVTVVKMVRPRGIEDMHARGRLTNRQLDTANRFYEIYERAHSDGVKAIDYSKVKVDGAVADGMVGEDTTFKAIKLLSRIEQHVGRAGYRILVQVIVEGAASGAVARKLGDITGRSPKMMEGYVTMRLIEALDELDTMWNVAEGTGKRGEDGLPVIEATGVAAADRGGVQVSFKITLPEGVTAEEFARNSAALAAVVEGALRRQRELEVADRCTNRGNMPDQNCSGERE